MLRFEQCTNATRAPLNERALLIDYIGVRFKRRAIQKICYQQTLELLKKLILNRARGKHAAYTGFALNLGKVASNSFRGLCVQCSF
ncbi:hypothetical protein D6817_00895 [Candidatus Pacearchaeota archaeon]|nr:MAG: hypothetical protein D6817_00895 [Candidatus Pacearchaeota archaeon]